ncbi:hypothetical protein PISMIDRAFT_277581 [Pisolithus microcarpus 441]|uniref:Uncharacterized protein n=1 Tax=Pisolithus microcarpus 441 TaxID=765257 RepID=A0A0C9XUP0_9AGAM|nr:hypothetical protein PISMIDRAFT_277581 [Pisolithus microcarpus 441]
MPNSAWNRNLIQSVFAPGSKKIPRCGDLVKRVTIMCSFGDTDISAWYVGNGWLKQRLW